MFLVSVPNVAYWGRRLELSMLACWNPFGDDLPARGAGGSLLAEVHRFPRFVGSKASAPSRALMLAPSTRFGTCIQALARKWEGIA